MAMIDEIDPYPLETEGDPLALMRFRFRTTSPMMARIKAIEEDPKLIFDYIKGPKIVRYRLRRLPPQYAYEWQVRAEPITGGELIGYGHTPRDAEIAALHLSVLHHIRDDMALDHFTRIAEQDAHFAKIRTTISEFSEGLLANRNRLEDS